MLEVQKNSLIGGIVHAYQLSNMKRAEGIGYSQSMPNAAWAWEFLRRNQDYRADYERARKSLPTRQTLETGSVFYIANDAQEDARQWGLLAFADPNKAALDADVFWHPDLLAGALRVKLTRPIGDMRDGDLPSDTIILSALQTRRVMLQLTNGARHILLNGTRFWIHLYSIKRAPPDDYAVIDVRFDGAKHMGRRLDTATQLLSLHRSVGGKLSLIGRRKNAQPLRNALTAFDVWNGFERPQGGLRDIAVALVGEDRVKEDWTGASRYLKDQARRARDKGARLVGGDYEALLSRKNL